MGDGAAGPKDIFRKLTSINLTAFCEPCDVNRQGMVIVGGIIFEKPVPRADRPSLRDREKRRPELFQNPLAGRVDWSAAFGSARSRRRGARTTTVYSAMPVISVFFGIIIRMYHKEHEPRHFHAEHQAREGKFDFDGNQTVGNITSNNALNLIREWAQLNRAALDANWSKIKAGQPLDRIPPLE